MGLIDTIRTSLEQVKASNVASGRTSASEMYANEELKQKEEMRVSKYEREKEQAEAERKRKADDEEQRRTDAAQKLKEERRSQFKKERTSQRLSRSEEEMTAKETSKKKLAEVERELFKAQERQKAEEFKEIARRGKLTEAQRKAEDEEKKPKKMKTFGESAFDTLSKPLYAVREKNIEQMQPAKPGSSKPLTKADVEKIMRKKSASKKPMQMGKGQFSAPTFRMGFGGGAPGVSDPLSGLTAKKRTGGKKKLVFDDWFKF